VVSVSEKLVKLTVDDFVALVGDSFGLATEEGLPDATKLTLTQTSATPHGRPGYRTPFTLLFEGPLDPSVAQGTFWLTHDKLGSLTIFLVPVGMTPDFRLYEAIFN